MPRKVKGKTLNEDFKEKFEVFKKALAENPSLSTDPILIKSIQEYGRMVELNDALYEKFKNPEDVMLTNFKGDPVVNPAIASYHKNQALLLKTSEAIWKKTETLVIGGGVKTW